MNVIAWNIRFLWRILKIALGWQAIGIPWLLIQIQVSKNLNMKKAVLFHAAYNTPWAKGFGDFGNLVTGSVICRVKTMAQNLIASVLQNLYEHKVIVIIIFVC